MKKVIITKGLPGSGKSTWAKQYVDQFPNAVKRINKDDLRAMLDNSGHSKDMEKFVLEVRDSIILLALKNGKHVIVDDTNLAPKHEAHIRELVKGLAEVEIKDFTHVPIDVCIQRDLERQKSVGEKVIRSMYNQFLVKKELYMEDFDLPKAIIVDVDGTLAHMDMRGPYDWDKVWSDVLDPDVANIVSAYKGRVIVMSGRDSVCRQMTKEWLEKHEIPYDLLLMRPEGNQEKDAIIKRRLFDEHIRGKFHVEYVLDDRNQVVEMWRNMGLKCFQVAEGDF